MYATVFKGSIDATYDNPPVAVGEYVWGEDYDGVQLYRCCYATVDIEYGEVVADDAVIIDAGSPTSDEAAGTNRLRDTGVFTSAEEIYIGAFGKILGDAADGGGQAFYVKSKVSDDELHIVCIAANNAGVHQRVTDGNWAIAVDVSEVTYDLWKPGRVRLGQLGYPPVGVCQSRGTSNPQVSSTKYFFAKCSGQAEVIGDHSLTALRENQIACCVDSGMIDGVATDETPTAQELASKLGIIMHGDLTGGSSDDNLVSVMLDVPIMGKSQHYPRYEHPMNAVTI